jgi:rare lipoprotein A
MVTNLDNGRSVEVTINDRGPFAKGRVLDLSYAAARSLGMIGPGTVPVRVEVISTPDRITTIPESLDYTLQVGSFAEIENALKLREQLSQNYSAVSQISIVPLHGKDTTYYRVQLGTFSSRAEAEGYAQQLAGRGLPIIIMEK